MREILFRGKRVDNGEWVEGYLLRYSNGNALIMKEFQRNELVDPATVGQYTGLTDKNGKKIFEGDIIEFTADVYQISNTGICVFKDGSYQIEYEYYKGCIHYHRIGQVDIEHDMGATYSVGYIYKVVGNIHDNPEMIYGGRQ